MRPSSRAARHPRPTPLRAIAVSALCAAAVGLFAAGSCHSVWCSGDCDDDDDFDDDDDVGTTSLAIAPPSYRLEHFDLVTSGGPGEHPVARLASIEGISLAAWAGSVELDAAELARFTARLLEHNEDLLGLPAAAGRLELGGVDFEPDATVVRWAQVRGGRAVPGAGTVFVFDRIGALTEIENRTLILE